MGFKDLFAGNKALDEYEALLEAFWVHARNKAKVYPLEAVLGADDMTAFRPPAFSGSEDREEAEAFCQSFLSGERDELVTPRADMPEDFPLPRIGELSILLDGERKPQALLRTRDVEVTEESVTERFEIIYRASDD